MAQFYRIMRTITNGTRADKPTLVVATTSTGKKNEFSLLLADENWTVSFVDAFIPDGSSFTPPEETGASYRENAQIKARALASLLPKTGEYFALADDSGIEVEALPHMFGVRSSRQYDGSTREKNEFLLRDLQNKNNRTARYMCALCLIEVQSGEEWMFYGSLDGKIAEALSGDEGFGFDPLLIPDGHTRTFAQLGSDIKNEISHRAKAVKEMKTFLQTYIKKGKND
jgi:XTP/dITP diphosphohydrolase